jgi:hypothetical protein
MKMNSLIRSALKRLVGDEAFKDELYNILEEVESTPEISRAKTVRREDPVPDEEDAPETEKEIVVDNALMEQIVTALTSNDDFMKKLAQKVNEIGLDEEDTTMTEETGEEIMQALKELTRGLRAMQEAEGEVSTFRARQTQERSAQKKSLADKANQTLLKMK